MAQEVYNEILDIIIDSEENVKDYLQNPIYFYRFTTYLKREDGTNYKISNYKSLKELKYLGIQLKEHFTETIRNIPNLDESKILNYQKNKKGQNEAKYQGLKKYIDDIKNIPDLPKDILYNFLGYYSEFERESSVLFNGILERLLLDRLLFGFRLDEKDRSKYPIVTKFFSSVTIDGQNVSEVIKRGEKIIKINGEDVSGKEAQDISELLHCPNRPIIITFRGNSRNGGSSEDISEVENKNSKSSTNNSMNERRFVKREISLSDEEELVCNGKEIFYFNSSKYSKNII